MRSHWQVTWSVWHALFMREVLARTMGDQLGWLWMLIEPIGFVILITIIRHFTGTLGLIGVDLVPWLTVGITGFFLFREGVLRPMNAIDASKALFAYRQVKPIDTVLVRGAIEGILKSIVFLILLAIGALLDYSMAPADPLGAMFVWFSIWLFGLGVGLVVAVGVVLMPSLSHVIRLLILPMYILSGALHPLSVVPYEYQKYLFYNPVLHGVEALRLEFFAGYHTLPGVSLDYLWYWNLAVLALGLALHVRFDIRLRAQ